MNCTLVPLAHGRQWEVTPDRIILPLSELGGMSAAEIGEKVLELYGRLRVLASQVSGSDAWKRWDEPMTLEAVESRIALVEANYRKHAEYVMRSGVLTPKSLAP